MERNRDQHGRWRNKTVAFRVSPEEWSLIENKAKLSGLTKQDYIIRRLTDKTVIVQGNTIVYKALKSLMMEMCEKISNIKNMDDILPEDWQTIQQITDIYTKMKEEE